MLEVDLADLASVHRLCDRLAQRDVRVDNAVFNAGLMPRTAQKTPQGYETMFAVHFLSSRVMLDRWLEDGCFDLPVSPARFRGSSSSRRRRTGPATHRLRPPWRLRGLRHEREHGALRPQQLVQCTFATELSRRLNPEGGVEVAVHAMCPGGVASNIARDTPFLLKPLANAVLGHFFQSPEEAIGPVIYLCCAEEAGRTTGMYLHLMQRKAVSPTASIRRTASGCGKRASPWWRGRGTGADPQRSRLLLGELAGGENVGDELQVVIGAVREPLPAPLPLGMWKRTSSPATISASSS